MPEVNQYQFKWREIGEMMIRASNISEGHWEPGFNYGVTCSQAPTPGSTNLCPMVGLQITGLILHRVEQPTAVSIDAASVEVF